PREEHGVELEALRLVEREEVDAARVVTAGVEAPAQVGDKRRCIAVERGRERDKAGEVGLADELALAELLGQFLEPAGLERRGANGAGRVLPAPFEPPRQPAGRVAVEERRALERDAGVVKRLLEVGQA